MIATIDDFLLFFDEIKPNEFKKADKKLNLVYLEAKPIKDKIDECALVEKLPGLIFSSKSKQIL